VVEAEIRSECAHCGEPMRIEVDSSLRMDAGEMTPLVSVPFVDVSSLGPSIIDGF
jgi:hypothetical protein